MIEFVGTVADANLTITEFFGASALSNGVDIKQRKSGTLLTIGNFKTIADMFDLFDVVTITTDTEATPNHVVRGRMEFADRDGIFQQLIDESAGAEDAFICTISDNLSAVGTTLSFNVHGYGFVAKP